MIDGDTSHHKEQGGRRRLERMMMKVFICEDAGYEKPIVQAVGAVRWRVGNMATEFRSNHGNRLISESMA